jgi:cell division transport system ATP-binding protein
MPKIVFQNVNVTYFNKKNENVVLKDFNVEFLPDITTILVGFSGCGKTTLLRTLFDGAYYEGKILIDDKNIEDVPVQDRGLAYVSQEYVLYPHMTIFDNIAFPLRNMKASSEEIRERVYAIAKELELTSCLSRKPRHLSGGQQQRVALARALVNNPSMIIADEPTGNLDPDTAWEIMNLLNDINLRGTTVVVATHAKDIVDRMNKRVIRISKGKIKSDKKGVEGGEA